MSVYLAAWARMREPSLQAVDRALYEERSLVRVPGMRGTLFVVPARTAPIIQAACSQAPARTQRRLVERLLVEAGVTGDPERWLQRLETETLAAIRARREATGAELGEDVPDLRRRLTFGAGGPNEGQMGLGTWVLSMLAGVGQIVRGRARGGWSSTQYRWVLSEDWLPGGLPSVDPEVAEAELARLYLAAYGPATEPDLRWWAGWTVRQARRAVAAIGAAAVEVTEGQAYVLADDLEPVTAPEPSAALLPALDPTVMGWARRAWYVGRHSALLFDRAGNAGPSAWWDGRAIGTWSQRPDGEIVVRVLEDVGGDAMAALKAAAAELQARLGTARVVVPFRSPPELASPSSAP